MAYTITELVPVNQYATIGYAPPIAQTPAVFGSVADGDDATFTTLEADFDATTGQHSEVLTLDFVLPDPAVVPAFYYMRMRARDNADYAANLDRNVHFFFDYSAVADAPGAPFDKWAGTPADGEFGQLGPLVAGSVTSADWFNFTYVGTSAEVDTANPSADSWFEVNADGGDIPAQTAAALAGDGLRFTFYPSADSNLDPRTAYIDVYEVRMVVAYAAPSGRVPPLRLFPRSDGRGASSAARVWPRPPTGNYGRVGPGSLV